VCALKFNPKPKIRKTSILRTFDIILAFAQNFKNSSTENITEGVFPNIILGFLLLGKLNIK
jgi:hypothetical protein